MSYFARHFAHNSKICLQDFKFQILVNFAYVPLLVPYVLLQYIALIRTVSLMLLTDITLKMNEGM